MDARLAFSGAILTGGKSSRMGMDKAFVLVDGLPLASRVEAAHTAAGATEVLAVGGDERGLRALGLRFVADLYPGDGPLGGIISALRAATTPVVVVTATDMPFLNGKDVTPLLDALSVEDESLVAVSAAEGHTQPMHAAWRVSALPLIERAFAEGQRSPRRLLPSLPHAVVELGGGVWSVDLDEPIA